MRALPAPLTIDHTTTIYECTLIELIVVFSDVSVTIQPCGLAKSVSNSSRHASETKSSYLEPFTRIFISTKVPMNAPKKRAAFYAKKLHWIRCIRRHAQFKEYDLPNSKSLFQHFNPLGLLRLLFCALRSFFE